MMKIQLFNKEQQTESMAAGQTVFSEGEKGEAMFAVLDGEVDIVIRGKVVETIGAGGVFGEIALFDDSPRAASAVIKNDARLVRIDQRRFMFLVQQNPYFALQLMSILAGRLRKFNERL